MKEMLVQNKVNYVAKRLYEMGWYEISLGDTIGIGTVEKTIELIDSIEIPRDKLAVHFHNTYNRAIENIVAALAKGISVIDSSVSGLGGWPYAKGASGNVSTEDVIYMLELLDVKHGVDLKNIIDIGWYISKEIWKDNLSKVTLDDLDYIQERKAIFK